MRYVKGDLLTAQEGIMIHGCNARGVMGSGVAKAIRDRFPWAYDAYRKKFEALVASGKPGFEVGQVVWAEQNGLIVANCITQKDYGREPNKVYVDYEGLGKALATVRTEAWYRNRNPQEFRPCRSVALPKIGAGLGGGDWQIIEGIIQKTLETELEDGKLDVAIYEWGQ